MKNHKQKEINLKTITDKVDKAILSLLSKSGPEQAIDRSGDYARDKTLAQLGLDPRQQLQLRSLLSNEFSFEVYPAFFQQFTTPDAIIHFFFEMKLQTFKDWIYEIDWQTTAVPEGQELQIDNLWIVFCDEDAEMGSLLKAQLHEHRQQCVIVQPGKKFEQEGKEHFVVNPQSADDFKRLFSTIANISKLVGVVYSWGFDLPEKCLDNLQEFHKKNIGGLVHLSNQLGLLDLSVKLWIVTQSMITDGNEESLANWPLNGLSKIILEEYPTLQCTYLALDSKVSVVEACDTLFCELTAKSLEPEIAYQNGNRLVARMVRGDIVEIRLPQFSSDKTYLIAGGLRLVGILLAKWYVSLGAKHLVLLDEVEVTPELQPELDNFKRQGVKVSVFTAQFDNETALQKIFDRIRNDLPPLRGLIQAAGVVDNDLLMNMTWSRFEEIYRLKVSGSWNLHKLTESLELDHFILFSSCLPDLAPLGKANHAVGNSFLDALSHYRKKRGLHSLSFDWGPRDLRHVEVRQIVEVSSIKRGIEPLLAEQTLQVLEQLFYYDKPQITICNIKWVELIQSFARENPLFDEIAIEMGLKRVDILNAYSKASPATRMEILQTYIHEQVRKVLQLHSSQNIEMRRDFKKMGMGTFEMKTLRNRIQADLHEVITLPINFIEAHPTIEELSSALSRLLKNVVEPIAKMPSTHMEVDLQEPIAIIGMSCRFPGNVTSPENYWTMLRAGVDAIIEDKPGKYGGFVEEFKSADRSFFGIDHHFLSLELAWEALEYAGMTPEKIKETKTGVFIGNELVDIANEISNYFELLGPSLSIDAGTASSLACLEIACEKLRLGLCDMAIAGGINVAGNNDLPQPPEGKCRSLDASANGHVLSDGGGLLLLKRLADATRDNNPILAIIKGISISRDGSIWGALKNGNIKPEIVQYIEAEGTGHIIDDSMEVNRLCSVYGEDRSKNNPLFMGSVKANMGHIGAASGIAGIIKCILSMKNEEIPPQLHFTELNPLIEEGRNYISVATTVEPWKEKEGTRYAAVNAFSLNGTTGHLILQQGPSKENKISDKPQYLITLSAKSPEELEELIHRYQTFLNKTPSTLAEIAYTTNTGREHFNYRAATLVKDLKELKAKIHKNDLLKGKAEIKKEIQVSDLDQAAQEFIKGATLDWDRFYEKDLLSKVPLPTYPFNLVTEKKSTDRVPRLFSEVIKNEVASEILSDNIAIIKGDRRTEKDLLRLKELKVNQHINMVIVIYPPKD